MYVARVPSTFVHHLSLVVCCIVATSWGRNCTSLCCHKYQLIVTKGSELNCTMSSVKVLRLSQSRHRMDPNGGSYHDKGVLYNSS